ncbi:hypothetical protein GCM10018790_57800 [Kitasatospora xanthocidica]|nr:hypothetical protein GCM10018790_57800 [Kitasatospora xanthocidica]
MSIRSVTIAAVREAPVRPQSGEHGLQLAAVPAGVQGVVADGPRGPGMGVSGQRLCPVFDSRQS